MQALVIHRVQQKSGIMLTVLLEKPLHWQCLETYAFAFAISEH